jgi:hypothetical protein
VQAAVAGIGHAIPDLRHDPAFFVVDHVPLDREELHVPVGRLRHGRRDPAPDRLAAPEAAEQVLDVGGVLGELIRPGVPVARGARLAREATVVVEGGFEFGAGVAAHGVKKAGTACA